MKTILIEQVANGWIVRNQDAFNIASCKLDDIHVYRSMVELQKDLPKLLGCEKTINDPELHEEVKRVEAEVDKLSDKEISLMGTTREDLKRERAHFVGVRYFSGVAETI